MKRTLILTLTAGALALSAALPLPVFGAEPLATSAPGPESTTDSTTCTLRDGPLVAASGGCCQRQGGVCGCRGGKAKCCDGTPGTGCSCRGDSTTPEEL